MKKYWIIVMCFFMMSVSAAAYIDPLGNLSLDEVREAAEVEEEDEMRERFSRETGLWGEDTLVETKIISYPDPLTRGGLHGKDRNVKAFEYKYSDGTTEVVTEDGRVLKER